MVVCFQVREKGRTTYNEVADVLVSKLGETEGGSATKDVEKTIRRCGPAHTHTHTQAHTQTHSDQLGPLQQTRQMMLPVGHLGASGPEIDSKRGTCSNGVRVCVCVCVCV